MAPTLKRSHNDDEAFGSFTVSADSQPARPAKDALCWAHPHAEVRLGNIADSDLVMTSTCFMLTLGGVPYCTMERLWAKQPACGVITALVSESVKVNYHWLAEGEPYPITLGDVISISRDTTYHTWQLTANEAEPVACARPLFGADATSDAAGASCAGGSAAQCAGRAAA